jgi:putative ABC transport system permease protein
VTLIRLVLADIRSGRFRSFVAAAAVVPIVFAHLVLVAVAGSLSEAPAGGGRSLAIVSSTPLDPATGRLDSATLDRLVAAGGPGVAAATPMIFRPVKIDETIFQLRAVDLGDWESAQGLRLLEGRYPAAGADELAVTEGIADTTSWGVGDTFEVFGARFTITAIVRAPGTKFASLWMDFGRADRLFETEGTFQSATLQLTPDSDPEEIRAAIDAAAEGRFSVYYEDEINELQGAGLSAASDLSVLGTSIGIAVLAFGSFNLTAVALAERSADLGIARVLGVSRRALTAFASVRSAVLSLGGFAVGAAVTWGFLATRPAVTLRSFVVTPRLTFSEVLLGLGVTAVATLAGAWIAAWRAAARPPRQLLEAR